jgi:hypothetical protein
MHPNGEIMKKLCSIAFFFSSVALTAVFFYIIERPIPVVYKTWPDKKCVQVINGDFGCEDIDGKTYEVVYVGRD